jgi:hypothetical protein
MERVSPKGECDEAGQQQRNGTDRDQEMREGHLGKSRLISVTSCGARCTAAWQSNALQELICPAGRRRTARKVAGTALCPPFDFREVVKPLGSSLPLIARFVTPLNCHQDNR